MEIPENIVRNAEKAKENLLPAKSKALYDKEYENFLQWKVKNQINVVTETIMMAYFQELSEKYTPNSLWTKYSQVKSELIVKENINISTYCQLIAFLKVKSKGYVPKKSKVLEGGQVLTFIRKAPNEIFLLHKVVLVMGVFGGLRRDDMVKMTIDDIEDKGPVILIKVPQTKTATPKSFTIIEGDQTDALNLVRQYLALRPKGIKERRFFLTYRNGKCIAMPAGKNTLGSVPSIIAKFLNLENAKEYTGHCLRRTSSTLLIEGGASFESLKLHGKWKSTSVAEGYIEESITSKNRIAKMIASSVTVKENMLINVEMEQNSASTSAIESQNFTVAPASFSEKFKNCVFNIGKPE